MVGGHRWVGLLLTRRRGDGAKKQAAPSKTAAIVQRGWPWFSFGLRVAPSSALGVLALKHISIKLTEEAI